VPSELADEYRIEVTMDGGPFKFTDSEPTVLKRSEIESMLNRDGGGKAKSEKKNGK